MWKQFWKQWTLDKPAALGDWLWEVLVVQLAALLDRVTLRRLVACVPVVFLVLAYAHNIPLPPELMLVGDLLAYIDVFAVIFLLSLIGRAGAVLFVLRRAAELAASVADRMRAGLQRLDFRHRREGRTRNRKRPSGRVRPDDGDDAIVSRGFAWA